MKTYQFKKQPLAIALGIILAGAGAINQLNTDSFELIPAANAQSQGNGGQGKGSGGKGGGGAGGAGAGGAGAGGAGGSSSLEDSVLRGKKSVILEADEDSDRPEWAGGEKELNPHSGTGNPNPGDMKGGDYGDLWIIARVPDTGEPILDEDSNAVQPIAFYDANPDPEVTELVMITDANGPVLLALNEEGEVIAGQTYTLPDGTVVDMVTSEVEFGRANSVRSPDKVTQKALDEAVSKIEAGTTITLDPVDGRIVIDGATIDSPLENMALYVALLDGTLPAEVLAKLPDSSLDLAATLLAAGGDKTADVDYVDYVYYLNNIMEVSPDFVGFEYDRDDNNQVVTYIYYTDESQTTTTSSTVNLVDYLSWVNGDISDTDGIEGFTSAVDDGVELIEFSHTQVFPYELTPENVTP